MTLTEKIRAQLQSGALALMNGSVYKFASDWSGGPLKPTGYTVVDAPTVSLTQDGLSVMTQAKQSSGSRSLLLSLGWMAGSRMTLVSEGSKDSVELSAATDEASVVIRDSQGFSANMGTMHLINPKSGTKETTSAASIYLFDKDGKMVWFAPTSSH